MTKKIADVWELKLSQHESREKVSVTSVLSVKCIVHLGDQSMVVLEFRHICGHSCLRSQGREVVFLSKMKAVNYRSEKKSPVKELKWELKATIVKGFNGKYYTCMAVVLYISVNHCSENTKIVSKNSSSDILVG